MAILHPSTLNVPGDSGRQDGRINEVAWMLTFAIGAKCVCKVCFNVDNVLSNAFRSSMVALFPTASNLKYIDKAVATPENADRARSKHSIQSLLRRMDSSVTFVVVQTIIRSHNILLFRSFQM